MVRCSYFPCRRWPGCFDSHREAPLGTHRAGTSGDKLSGLHQFEGGLPGPRSSGRLEWEPWGAAWSGEVEPQLPGSPPSVGSLSRFRSGRPKGLRTLAPCSGWRERSVCSKQHPRVPSARTEGSFFFFFIAVWIGSQRDLVLYRGSRRHCSGFRGAGLFRSWHTLPLSRRPLCLPRGGSSTKVRLTGPDPDSVGCGERLRRVSEPLSSRIQQSPQHRLAPLACQDDSNSAGHVWRWTFCRSLAHLVSRAPRGRTADSCGRDRGWRAGQRRQQGLSRLGAVHRKRGPGPFLSLPCRRNINFLQLLRTSKLWGKGT